MSTILLFEDKLGITSGYETIWTSLLLKAGIVGVNIYRRNAHTAFRNRIQLLVKKGNRKEPGFNEDPRSQATLHAWVVKQITDVNPDIIICMDASIFFICNSDWNQATPDKLRGGVYSVQGIPFLIMLGISAWHVKKKEKDIARLNEGYTDEEEWESEHGGDEADSTDIGAIWLEPVSIPYGKFVLLKDLEKANRLLRKQVQLKKETRK